MGQMKKSNFDFLTMLEELDLPSSVSQEKEKKIKQAFKKLILFDKNNAEEIANCFIDTVANNHLGVYYRELYFVLDLLILLLDNSKNNRARAICILGILNDLAYFELDSAENFKQIDIEIRKKLNMFTDEYFDIRLNSIKQA